jgi:hypothetical protein
MKARFTYEIVTPESAEFGDFAEGGFIDGGGWRYPVPGAGDDYDEWYTDIREVISEAQYLGINYDNGGWFESVDPEVDYATGEYTTYALHVEDVTPETYNRISRLIEGRNIFTGEVLKRYR